VTPSVPATVTVTPFVVAELSLPGRLIRTEYVDVVETFVVIEVVLELEMLEEPLSQVTV
jgi:hypothetical protein